MINLLGKLVPPAKEQGSDGIKNTHITAGSTGRSRQSEWREGMMNEGRHVMDQRSQGKRNVVRNKNWLRDMHRELS